MAVYEFVKRENIIDRVSDDLCLDKNIVQHVTLLLDEGQTVPFISRYRQNVTKGIACDEVRKVKLRYESLKNIAQEITKVHEKIVNDCIIDSELEVELLESRSVEDVKAFYRRIKGTPKGTLAQRALALGLEPLAIEALAGKTPNFASFLSSKQNGLQTLDSVEEKVVHIISSRLSRDSYVRERMINFCARHPCSLLSKVVPKSAKKENLEKFKVYFNFERSESLLLAHQILAINRGEHLGVLKVSVTVSNLVQTEFVRVCTERFGGRVVCVRTAIDYAWKRLVLPRIRRACRQRLTDRATQASLEVFCRNVSHLLRTPPIPGVSVMGIDPGYVGCKLAVLSPSGAVLATDMLTAKKGCAVSECATARIRCLLLANHCELIAVGDGSGSGKIQKLLSDAISSGVFRPLDVRFTVVSEAGSSVYSVDASAVSELPELDPRVRSAVSIGRRLQDPLAELVKMDARHLGVGMYQHDVCARQLAKCLNATVEDVVSLVGVNLNTASTQVLSHIAGIGAVRARKILAWRERNGPFTNRQQLLSVAGIGPGTFQNCAGFLKILPPSDMALRKSYCFLDATSIHPESYGEARSLLRHLKLEEENIGNSEFIGVVCSVNEAELSRLLNIPSETLAIILAELRKPLGQDCRLLGPQPLFRSDLLNASSVRVGTVLSAVVRNVTTFGAFADTGLGRDCLVVGVHSVDVSVNDRIRVKVTQVKGEKVSCSLHSIEQTAPKLQ